MPDTPAFLSKRLQDEGEKIYAVFASLSDEQWKTEVYTEGTVWTIRNVLAHFVTAERGFLKLFADIQAGGPGASEDFSLERYNSRQQEKTRELSPQELLAQFQEVRAEMVAWVGDLSEVDLKKEGRHPFLGQVALAEMIMMVYRHNMIHYRDIRKVLNA